MLAEFGVTVTDATGGGGAGFTVIEGVVAVIDSLVAETVAEPGATAVRVMVVPVPVLTELATLTVSTAVLLELHVTVRPASAVPPASLGVAVSDWVVPAIIGVVTEDRPTDATGTGMTVMELVPVCPSLVAVMVTGPPAATAVTSPLASTVATAASFVDQVTVRPVSTLPSASRVSAVSCCVAPTWMVADGGLTVTELTGGGITVIDGVVAVTASLVAEIVAEPRPTAVRVIVAPLPVLTELAALTDRTAVLLELQVTVRPESALPPASLGVAVSCSVAPTIIGVVTEERPTDATGAGLTVIELVPLCPSLVAVIVTGPPALTAVTRPFASTVATEGAAEVQVMLRPVRTLFDASLVSAVSC